MPLDRFGLGPERSFSKITYIDFEDLSEKYGILDRDTYENSDNFRLKSIPESLHQCKEDGYAFLEKTELQILAEWRRKHDFQHASTPGVLASNSIKKVREVKQAAFGIYGNQHHYVDAVKKLTELEGVSFPIATLILAEDDPVNIPYFTEGLYRWLWEDDAKDGIWDRKINFIMKQYKVLAEKVAQLRGKFRQKCGAEVAALDVEKVERQINERAQERKKPADDGEDDFLLRPPGPWSSKKRKLGSPLRDEERVPKHRPKKVSNGSAPHGVPVSENERSLLTQPTVPARPSDNEGHEDDGRLRLAY